MDDEQQSPMFPMKTSHIVLHSAFLLTLTLVVFWGSLDGEFVWDDTKLILRDPRVQEGASFRSIFRSVTRIKKVSEENLRAIEEMEGLIASTRSHSKQLYVEVSRLKV